ncbi:hypothetical protein [Caballeronia mineralivorans]|uniref:hypothetical protein n=1 Tax=Caballeronia mineralivorans TaxID=2010198 RepID=UPI000A5144F0|nr:hypothetical protein [Caballeronia mineralivorans]
MRRITTAKVAAAQPECRSNGSTAHAASEFGQAALLLADAQCVSHNVHQSV